MVDEIVIDGLATQDLEVDCVLLLEKRRPMATGEVLDRGVADRLATRSRGLAGRLLSVSPSSR